MNKDIAKLWTAALRSGKYKQGHGYLHSIKDDNETFCCLGVLCDLYQQDRRKEKKKGLFVDKTDLRRIKYNHMGGVLPLEVSDWANMASTVGEVGDRSLARMNDAISYDFKLIAEFIEDNVEVL
jgi:hypothetical protein